MGKRGPAREPTRIKQLKGKASKKQLKSEPKPSNVEPECPSFLTKEAKKEWNYLCNELRNMKMLHACDKNIVACLAEAWADWKECRQKISKEGRWIFGKSENGNQYYQLMPWMTLEKRAKADILRFSGELGLTPSARARISLNIEENKDDLDAILNEGCSESDSILREDTYAH